MLSRWRMTEQQSGAQELGQIRLVFLELPKYGKARPPVTVVEKWAYFFREADNFSVVPEVLSQHPFVDALEAARTAGFSAAEWEAYILAGIAIQNERGALSVAEKRGHEQGIIDGRIGGLRMGVEALCGALGIELSDGRRQHMESLDVKGLEALLSELREQRRWP